MSEPKYYSQQISIPREFLIKTYAHPLLAQVKDTTEENETYRGFWKNTPDPYIDTFGGVSGTQFRSKEAIISFNEAFNRILSKHRIGSEHKHKLLYLIRFYGEDVEKQSVNNNRYNRLLEYTKFILDICRNSEIHIHRYSKNKDYQIIHDPYTTEYFFARTSVVEKYPIEEIIEFRPNDNPGDIISYMRFDIGLTELYVPYDLAFNLASEQKLRNFDGVIVPKFDIPQRLQAELFKYTFNCMLEEHRLNNTNFYKTISETPLTADDFKKLYRKYKRNVISQNESLIQIGTVISEYLTDNKLIKSKLAIAGFLFDYFAIFKLLKLKNPKEFPKNYEDMSRFYNQNGITSETIRLMMKEDKQVGEI